MARYNGTGGALQGSGVVIDDGGNLVAGRRGNVSHITIGAPKDTANADVGFRASGSNRWTIRRTADTESGSNAGSHLALIRRDDGGSAITPNVLQIYRDSGKIRIGSVGPTAGLEMGSGGPTWTVGTGVPSHSAPTVRCTVAPTAARGQRCMCANPARGSASEGVPVDKQIGCAVFVGFVLALFVAWLLVASL